MSSVAVYSSRSRATERTRNIRNDMNRASAYIMQNDYSTPSSYSSNQTYKTPSTPTVKRRTRDSSLGTLGRPNRDSSMTRTSTYTRESSMPRYKELLNTSSTLTPSAPTSLITSIISNRHSIAIPVLDNGLGTETAKYNRQNELKEIHNNFMKGFKDTNNKLSNEKTITDDQGERRSKAYAKIIGDQSSYAAEVDYQRHNYSDMYIETGKFSTRTLSAIKNLDGAEIKQKRRDPGEYSWRKDMEQYEKSSEFEKEKRIRNIANHSRQRDDTEGKENQKNMSIQNRNRNSLLNTSNKDSSSAKPPQSPKTRVKFTPAPKPEVKVEPVRTPAKTITQTKLVVDDKDLEVPTPRKSWRERVAEKEMEEPVKTPAKVIKPKTEVIEEAPRKPFKERMAEKEKRETVKTNPETVTKPEDIEEPVFEMPTPRKSWKERQAEREKDGYTKTKEELDEEKNDRQKARESARAIRQQLEAELEEMNKNFAKSAKKDEANVDKEAKSKDDGEKNTDGNEDKDGASQEEEDDAYGSKKLKADFDAKMLAMEEEFAAGRSKLTKLRERIRKAKGVVKEADTTIEESKSS